MAYYRPTEAAGSGLELLIWYLIGLKELPARFEKG